MLPALFPSLGHCHSPANTSDGTGLPGYPAGRRQAGEAWAMPATHIPLPLPPLLPNKPKTNKPKQPKPCKASRWGEATQNPVVGPSLLARSEQCQPDLQKLGKKERKAISALSTELV